MKNKIETLIKDAMKNGDTVTRDTLRVLKGDIERNEQGDNGKVILSDLEIMKLAKKMSENIRALDPSSLEIKVLEPFAPQSMTEEELEVELNEVLKSNKIDSMKGLGVIMKHFKDNFDGQYDGKKLTEMIKTKF